MPGSFLSEVERDRLNRFPSLVQRDVTFDEQSSPNQGADVPHNHSKLIDLYLVLFMMLIHDGCMSGLL